MWRQCCWKPNNIRYCICTTLPLLSAILYIMIIYLHVKRENYMNHSNHNAFNTYSHGLMPSSLDNFRKQTYFGVLFMLHAIMQFISTYSVPPFESGYCYNGVQHILSQDMAFKKWSALMPILFIGNIHWLNTSWWHILVQHHYDQNNKHAISYE